MTEKTNDMAVPNGQMGDRNRGLFEIRIPKIIIRNINFNVRFRINNKPK